VYAGGQLPTIRLYRLFVVLIGSKELVRHAPLMQNGLRSKTSLVLFLQNRRPR
jgi:hypothetical protein